MNTKAERAAVPRTPEGFVATKKGIRTLAAQERTRAKRNRLRAELRAQLRIIEARIAEDVAKCGKIKYIMRNL